MEQIQTKPIRISIPSDVHRQLRIICAQEDLSHAEFFTKCIQDYAKLQQNKG